MSYHIYLSINNNEELIELPVLPKKIEISGSGNNKSTEILNLGEVTQLKLPKLFSLQIDAEFPAKWYPGCNVSESKLLKPYDYAAIIEKWRRTLKPIRLVFIGSTIDINAAVSIESFSYNEEGGNVGTWSYKLKLKEYRFFGADKINIDSNVIQKSRSSTKTVNQLYTVREGDTLTSISIKNFGDESAYWDIKRLNGLTDTDLLNGLKPGMELRLF
ncbi:MAG: LysM peptidoglycan-binding domain-containing protein [Clostridia bacterium]|nr:LysM peptidoglycan-binding domain-containing protein [Clostridia bacterium]